jgi:integrase
MKFTKTSIAELTMPEGKADHFVWDDDLPGFGIRLRGSARWVIEYRVNGQKRREMLGDIRQVTMEAAKKIAKARFAQVQAGIDPGAEKAEAEIAKTKTFANVVKLFLEVKKAELRPSTYRTYVYDLQKLSAPFNEMAINAIKLADIAVRLREIVAGAAQSPRGRRSKEEHRGRGQGKRTRKSLSTLFTWAMGEGIVENNPVIATNNPGKGIRPRDRVLSDDELRLIWLACEDDNFGRITKLLILTGCRLMEIGGLKWREINLAAGTLSLPGERTKNKQPLFLDLPELALEVLRGVPVRNDSEYLFNRGKGPPGGFAANKNRLDKRIAVLNMNPWTLHDLRRTMRTGIGRLGIPPHVAERVINHVKGGIEAVYDRYKYEPEMKSALAIWADHVAAVVAGKKSNVSVLKRA